MTSNNPRKRKHRDSATTPSPRSQSAVPERVASEFTRNDSHNADLINLHRIPGRDEHLVQSYNNPVTRENARAHYGNNVYYNVTNSNTETAEERLYQSFMKSLKFDGMDLRRAVIDPAYAKTCQWIFREERFLRWQDPAHQSSNRGFLWIRGKPGSGKSTIMKCILEHLQRRESGCKVISFFFNARGHRLEKSAEGCYRSLLYQMLEQMPKLRTSLRLTNFPTDGQDWDIAVIRDTLREAVHHLHDESLILMVDALDECKLEEVRDMVYFLEGLAASTRLQVTGFHVCLASRHYPTITIRFCEILVVEGEDAHTKDIHDYIQDNLHVEPEEHRHMLLEKLIHRSQGVFMWVILVTRRLNTQFNEGAAPRKLLADLGALPVKLNDLIHSIISEGASDTCLLPTLLWSLAANPPRYPQMELDDLCLAVQFNAGKLTSPRWDQSMVDLDNIDAMKRFVLHASKGLLEIIRLPEDKFQFQYIHESVRQHILDGGLATLNPSLGCNVEAAWNAILAEWCQKYIWADVFKYVDFPIDPLSGLVDWEALDEVNDTRSGPKAFPFLMYALKSTFDHMEAAYVGKAFDLSRLSTFPVKHWISIHNIFPPRDEDRDLEPTASLLYLCLQNIALFDDHGMARGLLEQHPQNSGTFGAVDGDMKIMDKSLSMMMYGASLDDYCGGRYGTPLVAAAHRGNTCIIASLLCCGAGVNVCDDGSDPHSDLVRQADPNTVRLHLDDRARDSQFRGYGSPLAAASRHDDNLPMVKLLLSHGADINVRHGSEGSALGSAAYKCCMEVVDFLLDNGADINLEDDKGWNIALWQTIRTQKEDEHGSNSLTPSATLFSKLLERGAHAKPTALNAFLHTAARKGRARLIEILLQAGADPTWRDRHDCTALHALAEGLSHLLYKNRVISVAHLLLNLGVDVNAQGGEFDTALIAASAMGNDKLVRVLLDHGADVHHESKTHGTAVDAARASEFGTLLHDGDPSIKIIQMLSEAGLE
jgi:ankyrin repeat protein